MHTHSDHDPETIDTSRGYEATDIRFSGIVIFLVALTIFAVVTAMLSYGVGKVLNARMSNANGPQNKWSQPVDVRSSVRMPSNPELQAKMSGMTQGFPTPKVQSDDGNQDVADLHAREDVLLNHYSWVDKSQGKVRIPIERAMELLGQRGLRVVPVVEQSRMMTGDRKAAISEPLTNGFARTGYESDQAQAISGK